MRKLILIWFALVGIGLIKAHAQENALKMSLEDACKLAIDSNLEVLNAKLENEHKLYELREKQSKLYPQIDAYSDLNYYFAIPKMIMPGEFFGETGNIPVEIGTKYDWSSGFNSSLSLVDMSYHTSIRLAKRMQNLSTLNLEQKKEEMVYQVWQVYLLCQSTESQIAFLNKNMANTMHLLEITKSQADNGVIRKIDYSKVMVTKNNLQTEIDNLNKLKEQQLNLLRFLVGLDFSQSLELTDTLTANEIAPELQPDFSANADIRELGKQIEISALSQKLTKQMYLPTLSTSGHFFYQGQQNSFNFFNGSDRFFKVGYLGVNLSIPVFDGGEKHSKIQQYNIEQQQLINSKMLTANKLTKDYLNSVKQYSTSKKSILRQQENIEIAEEDYRISLEQYKQQVLSLSDLMLSENSLTEARLSYADALLELNNAMLEIKKIKGDLLHF